MSVDFTPRTLVPRAELRWSGFYVTERVSSTLETCIR